MCRNVAAYKFKCFVCVCMFGIVAKHQTAHSHMINIIVAIYFALMGNACNKTNVTLHVNCE